MLLCASYCIRLLRLQFYDFSVNYEGLPSTIEPFDGTNFPKRNKEVHAVLKVLDLDYALYEDKTVNPSISTENHNEQLREYNSKLEKWQKKIQRICKISYKIFDLRCPKGSISLYEG